MPVEESQLYRDLMRLKPDSWTANAWAVRAGVSRTVWTDMRRHGNPSRRTLEKLLTAAGSSLAEFEALRVGEASGLPPTQQFALADSGPSTWQSAPLPPLPVVASSLAGAWGDPADEIALTELCLGEITGHVDRPAQLRNDSGAFAFTVVSAAMWPRFRVGRLLAVSPREMAKVGDDGLFSLSAPGSAGRTEVLIAELVGREPRHFQLRQFNPDRIFRVTADHVFAAQKIVGELI